MLQIFHTLPLEVSLCNLIVMITLTMLMKELTKIKHYLDKKVIFGLLMSDFIIASVANGFFIFLSIALTENSSNSGEFGTFMLLLPFYVIVITIFSVAASIVITNLKKMPILYILLTMFANIVVTLIVGVLMVGIYLLIMLLLLIVEAFAMIDF